MTLSYHAQYERAYRLNLLEETLGFTHIVLEAANREKTYRYCVTSSGILIVKPYAQDLMVTAYMVGLEECYRVARAAGKSCIPPKLEKRIRKNFERHAELYRI